MAAAGRLWRRAPAWRLCLITALGLTGLAAMFPPALPDWGRKLRSRAVLALHAAPPGATAPQPGARFVPVPDAAPASTGEMSWTPAPGTGRSGIMAFAGRRIPLPAGQWQVLVLARDNSAIPIQDEVLGRIEAGQLTGLIEAEAPNPINGAALPLLVHAGCGDADALARQAAPEPFGQDPSLHECWALRPSAITSPAARPDVDDILRRGLDRLDRSGVAVPGHVMALEYLRSDQTGWLKMLLLLPDKRADQPKAATRLAAWAKRYAERLHDGFTGPVKGPAEDQDP